MDYNLFDIVFCKFPEEETFNGVQAKSRPCVIVQNNVGNEHSPTLIVMEITKQIKKLGQPTHALIRKNKNNNLRYDSMIVGEQIHTVSKENVVFKIGYVDNDEDKCSVVQCYLANLYGRKVRKVVFG